MFPSITPLVHSIGLLQAHNEALITTLHYSILKKAGTYAPVVAKSLITLFDYNPALLTPENCTALANAQGAAATLAQQQISTSKNTTHKKPSISSTTSPHHSSYLPTYNFSPNLSPALNLRSPNSETAQNEREDNRPNFTPSPFTL